MAINEAYNVDCIEYMRTLPDNYFDLAVCDPPYGSGNDTKLGGGKRFGGIFDRYCKLEQTQGRKTGEVLLPSPTNGRRQIDSENGSGDTSSRSWKQTWGGYYRPLHGMLPLLSCFSMSYSG